MWAGQSRVSLTAAGCARRVLCLALGWVAMGSTPVLAAGPSAADAGDARAWLSRTHAAASQRNYQGTLVVSSAGGVSSSRVLHFSEGQQQFERIDWLDGEARSVLRHNELVHTVWPRARVVVVEQRDARAAFPALLPAGDQQVLTWYELKSVGQDRIAGHDADVVLLRARDGLRFSQRLWAERQSGLLLRADILAPNGQVLESAAFSELVLGIRPQSEQVRKALRSLDGYRVLRPAQVSVQLAAEGWSLGALPAGFKEVHCARRSLDPSAPNGQGAVLQTILSDGLTHVSLFIEPFDPQRHQAESSSAMGATQSLMFRVDEHWITVMGDVPMETLRRVAVALERKR